MVMTNLRKNHWNIYPPKTLSREAFHNLVTFLKVFKAELKPSKRTITVEVSGEDLYARKCNDEADTILAPFVLEKIREVKIFLRLDQNDQNSCESLVHISPASTFVSTSDIGTDWGAAIQADLNRHLRTKKIVAISFWARLNGLLKVLMCPFLILGGVYYILWHFEKNTAFLMSMCGFLLAGLLLLAKDIQQYFVPPKPFQAITVEKKRKGISVQLWVTILSLLAALLGVAKELLRLLK
jgi:hypothetical protein